MPNPNRFRCEACGQEFESREKLDKHNREQHAGKEKVGAAGGRSDKGMRNE